MSELNLCPFCGGEALLREIYVEGIANRKHYRRECRHCKATFADWYRSIKKADEAWNRRTDLLREVTNMVPLNIEVLMGMDGEPVWCDWIDGWGLVHIDGESKIEFSYYDGSKNTYDEIVDCGIEPLVYHSKPQEEHHETD